MNFLPVYFLALFFFLGCSSNSGNLTDYVTLNEQIQKSMERAGGATKAEGENGLPDYGSVPNYVAPGFSFQISHPSDARLAGTFRSDFNGNLKLPYDVEINISNKTFAEVRELVDRSYNKFFQRGSEGLKFSISKKEYWVEVRGLVKKPGRYLVKSSDTIDLVVDQAGGVQGDITVDYFNAKIEQGNFDFKVLLNQYFESSNAEDKIRWLGGDSVFISKLDTISGKNYQVPFVTVIGGVNKPGKVLYQKDASLYYFIEKSGGTVQALGYEECYIFRNTKEGVKKIHFAFNKPETIPAIMPNDTIFMNTQVRTLSDIWLERISNITSILSTAALLIIAL